MIAKTPSAQTARNKKCLELGLSAKISSRKLLTRQSITSLRRTVLDVLKFEAGLSKRSGCRQFGRTFATRAECLLKYGRFFMVDEFTNSVYDYGSIKQCFSNARTAVSRHAVLYCEGVAISEDVPVPIHHAWITEPGHPLRDYPRERPAAFEVTIPKFDVYFGIAFSGEFSRKLLHGKPTGRLNGEKNKTDFWNRPGEYADAESLAVLDQWGANPARCSKRTIPFVKWAMDAIFFAPEEPDNPDCKNSLREISKALAWPIDKQDSGSHDLLLSP